MLSEHELKEVQVVSSRLTQPVTLKVFRTGAEDNFQNNLFGLAAQVSGVSANKILFEESDKGPFPDKPSVTVSASGKDRIHYCALPEGSEFRPFLNLISWLGKDPEKAEAPEGANFKGQAGRAPIEILVLMASMCPHCPSVVNSCLELAVLNENLNAIIADATVFTDLAEKYKVKSTPTVVINETTTVVGQTNLTELADKVSQTIAPQGLTDTLKSMINSGRAEDAGALLVKESANTKAILPLYKSGEFSTRMGVLVALEEALEIDPRSLDSLVEDLLPLLESKDVGLRGDTAELLGNIGMIKAADYLVKLKEDPDEDVREAAIEALEKLQA